MGEQHNLVNVVFLLPPNKIQTLILIICQRVTEEQHIEQNHEIPALNMCVKTYKVTVCPISDNLGGA